MAEPPAFWSLPSRRPDILADVKHLFDPAGGPAPTPSLTRGVMLPLWDHQNGINRFRYDLVLRSPRYFTEGYLVVSAPDAPDGNLQPNAWRVERVELLRARPLSAGPALKGPPSFVPIRPT